MQSLANLLVPAAVGAVTIVLFLGLANMVKGGNPSRSQNLMRWRVILQAVAVAIIMAVIYFKTRGG